MCSNINLYCKYLKLFWSNVLTKVQNPVHNKSAVIMFHLIGTQVIVCLYCRVRGNASWMSWILHEPMSLLPHNIRIRYAKNRDPESRGTFLKITKLRNISGVFPHKLYEMDRNHHFWLQPTINWPVFLICIGILDPRNVVPFLRVWLACAIPWCMVCMITKQW